MGKVATTEASLDHDFKISHGFGRKTHSYVRENEMQTRLAMLRKVARDFGAKGVGLCRTEHMFFEGDRIDAMREMILSDTVEQRRIALSKILPMQRSDFEGILEAMDGLGVTIRLLDPPLHEFTPNEPESQKYMAEKMGISVEVVKEKVAASLHEFNPTLGLPRLPVRYRLSCEITEMQAGVIDPWQLVHLKLKGLNPKPEIMAPFSGYRERIETTSKHHPLHC